VEIGDALTNETIEQDTRISPQLHVLVLSLGENDEKQMEE
jgi:hypothetical protein